MRAPPLRVVVTGFVGLVVGPALSCLHRRAPDPEPRRVPCDGATGWSPEAALYLQFSQSARVPIETVSFDEGILLWDAGGRVVPVLFAANEEGEVVVCPVGGLAPDASYGWTVGPFAAHPHQLEVPAFEYEGSWYFKTGPSTGEAVTADVAACRHAFTRVPAGGCEEDSGEAGDAGDSGP